METCARILAAATDLFMKYGIRSVTMDEIAKSLSISKKTIYQYFKDKHAVVFEVTKNKLQQEQKDFENIQAHAENVIDELLKISLHIRKNLRMINPTLFYDLKKFHPIAWEAYQEHKEFCLKKGLLLTLERGIQEGVFREEIDIEILARMRLHQVEMGFDPDIYPIGEFDITEVHMQFFFHFIHGIVNEKGRKLIKENYSQLIFNK